MAHHKRKKPKRKVKCTMCTQHRWKGNSKDRSKAKEQGLKDEARKIIDRLPAGRLALTTTEIRAMARRIKNAG